MPAEWLKTWMAKTYRSSAFSFDRTQSSAPLNLSPWYPLTKSRLKLQTSPPQCVTASSKVYHFYERNSVFTLFYFSIKSVQICFAYKLECMCLCGYKCIFVALFLLLLVKLSLALPGLWLWPQLYSILVALKKRVDVFPRELNKVCIHS